MVVERSVIVQLPMGLHARPAAELARLASQFSATIELIGNGGTANARSALELIGLALEVGSTVVVRAIGEDAAAAVERIAAFLQGAG